MAPERHLEGTGSVLASGSRSMTSGDLRRPRQEFEPVTSSVSESAGSRMTCNPGRRELLSWGIVRPPVSAVVRDLRVECGPDVAPLQPREEQAGEKERGSGVVAMVTSSTGGEARPRRPLASLASLRRRCGRPVQQQPKEQVDELAEWSNPPVEYQSRLGTRRLKLRFTLEVQRSRARPLPDASAAPWPLGDPPAGRSPATPPNRWPLVGRQEAGRHADRPCRPGREHRHPG
jgi:hypothetical protein